MLHPSAQHGVLRTALRRDPVAEPVYGPSRDPIEVMPVVVLFQVFPARPSSIPDIRDFVRRCLAESPLTEEGNREVGETVFRALLDAAGPSRSSHVACRIFPGRLVRATGQGRAPRQLRGLYVGGAAPGGPDPGGRGPAARGLGQDGQPLGGGRARATPPRPAAYPGSIRRDSAAMIGPRVTSGKIFMSAAAIFFWPLLTAITVLMGTGRCLTSVLRCCHGG